MKKIIAVAASVLMISGLAACGSKAGQKHSAGKESRVKNEAENLNENEAENLNENEAENFDDMEDNVIVGADAQNDTNSQEAKVLVAYFSATNTTKGVAEYIADVLNADIYEIIPEEPYTDADLNYNDNNSRTTMEMDDSGFRPVISGAVEDMEQYDIVFIGYPIWHGQAPRIISTFLESYDFSGKTIVPFCTSHSSGVGSSADNLHSLCADSTEWREGMRFGGGTEKNTIEEWLVNVGIE